MRGHAHGWGAGGVMSAMGKKRRFLRRPITSGLPRQTDICSTHRHVSIGPISGLMHRSKLRPIRSPRRL
jgi:hypothetical protein